MATAVEDAFAVPELLEAILLELPTQDLLLAQRVSRTFRDSIKCSIQIQRALFFQPTPTNKTTSTQAPTLNPLAGLAFTIEFQPPKFMLATKDSGATPGQIADGDDGEEACHMHLRPKLYGRGRSGGVALRPNANLNAGQSWERMLVCTTPYPIFLVDDCPCHLENEALNEVTLGGVAKELLEKDPGDASDDDDDEEEEEDEAVDSEEEDDNE